MIIVKYSVTFTAIGDFALQLLRTRGSLIIFDKGVPLAYENMVPIASQITMTAKNSNPATCSSRANASLASWSATSSRSYNAIPTISRQ